MNPLHERKKNTNHQGKLIVLGMLLVLGSVVFSSCTVQKRVHRKGWHVSWNHSKKSKSGKENSEKETVAKKSTEKKEEVALKTLPVNSVQTEEETALYDAPESSTLTESNSEVQNDLKISTEQDDEIIWEDDYPTPSSFAPLVAGFGTGAFIFVALTQGWISVLVPIGVTVLIAIIAWLGMRYQIKKGNGMKYNKNFLWWMLACTIAAFTLYFLFFGGVLSGTPIVFLGLAMLALLSGAFLGKIKKDQQDEKNKNTPQPTKEETINTTENVDSQTQTALAFTFFALAILLGLLGLLLLVISSGLSALTLPVIVLIGAAASMVLSIYFFVESAR